MATATPLKHPTLAERSAKWRRIMQDADTGPLVIAKDIVDLSEHWSDYAAEAEGMTINAYLQRTFGDGKRLSYWERRHEAVEQLGEFVRRTINHDVAIWLVGYAPAEKWNECVQALMRARKANGDNCVTLAQARPIVEDIVGGTKRHRCCQRCAEKDKRIAELEAELVTLRAQRH